MKKQYLKLLMLMVVLSLILTSCNFNQNNILSASSKVKTFEEISLKYYDKEFESIYIWDDNSDVRHDSNNEIIEELIDYFKTLKYIKVNTNRSNNEKYDINFQDKSANRLEIEIEDETYIIIGLRYIKEVKTEDKTVNKIIENDESIKYKIHDGKIDLKYIESIFQSLRELN